MLKGIWGAVVWIFLIYRMTFLIQKHNILVPCRWMPFSKPISQKTDLVLFILFLGNMSEII